MTVCKDPAPSSHTQHYSAHSLPRLLTLLHALCLVVYRAAAAAAAAAVEPPAAAEVLWRVNTEEFNRRFRNQVKGRTKLLGAL